MIPARCPVCSDIITIGVTVKLSQGIICPTCLTSLRVVSLNPMELELPEKSGNGVEHLRNRPGQKKNSNNVRSRKGSGSYGGFDDLDESYEDFDDYVLERRLRSKTERERQRKTAQK